MHTSFGEDQTCSSKDMIEDRQTHTHTDTIIAILHFPVGGGVINSSGAFRLALFATQLCWCKSVPNVPGGLSLVTAMLSIARRYRYITVLAPIICHVSAMQHVNTQAYEISSHYFIYVLYMYMVPCAFQINKQ